MLTKSAALAMNAAGKMLFAQQVVQRANDDRISVGLALQYELDALVKEHPVTQPFPRILPTLADEHVGWDDDGGQVGL